jgi:Zn-dependent protease with chaperone function
VVVAPVAVERSSLEVGDAEIRANRRRARLLVVAAGAVPGVVVLLAVAAAAGPLFGVVAGVVFAGAVAVLVWVRAAARALRLVGGAPLEADDEPGLANLVAGLCATFGVPMPRLWLVDDPVPNACSLGRGPSASVLVVTSGLLDALGLIETEGVVAHELAHVKRHDTAVSEVAVTICAPLVRLTGSDRLLHRAVGFGREYRADQVAAATVRYPPGLRGALEAMERGPAPGPGSVFTGSRWLATRWLWIDPMVGARQAPAVGEIDATGVRRAALAEW